MPATRARRPAARERALGGRRPAGRRAAVSVSIPSETAFLGLVRDVTQRLCSDAGFDAAAAGQIALAVDEAVSNVLEHAYAGARDRRVEVRYEDHPTEVRIEILDNGVKVDPRTRPPLDLRRYAQERRTGGLGVHLMERIMDSVTYRRLARRNACILVKTKRPGGTAE